MKKIYLLISLVIILNQNIFAQQEKSRIAVLELSADGITASETQTFTNRLRSELVKTGAFMVLERGEMDDILKEQCQTELEFPQKTEFKIPQFG